jgi:CheY-like chemotaxis protein
MASGSKLRKHRCVLMVDDDPEDIFLTRDALKEVAPQIEFKSLNDGQELMDYLSHTVKTVKNGKTSLPELILLDLNMPRKGGFEALDEIRSNPCLKRIPVVILSTSTTETDINRSFDAGANSFLSKPQTYNELLAVMHLTVDYWFGISRLPSNCPASDSCN